MNLEELKSLLESAITATAANAQKNAEIETQIKTLESNNELEDIKNELSDLRAKMKTPIQAVPKAGQDAIRELAVKSFNGFVKGAKATNVVNFKNYENAITEHVKALNVNVGDESALLAVAEVLSYDLMEYARDFSPILSEIGMKSGLTRDYRQLVLSSYPTVADGIEAVAGTNFAVTGTQTYRTVRSDVIKIMANAPISDEAMMGTDYNVYADLVRLLGDQVRIELANKVLYGNGTEKSGRGILSSGRINVAAAGEGSYVQDAIARDAELFPVFATGSAASLGANNGEIQDMLIDLITHLPTKYLGSAKFYMNRRTKGILAKIRDDMGNPVFMNSAIQGGMSTLFGYPVVLDDTLPDVAAGSTPIIFGDLKQAFYYSMGDVNYVQLNPYKTQGMVYIEHSHEIFTCMGLSDAIQVVRVQA